MLPRSLLLGKAAVLALGATLVAAGTSAAQGRWVYTPYGPIPPSRNVFANQPLTNPASPVSNPSSPYSIPTYGGYAAGTPAFYGSYIAPYYGAVPNAFYPNTPYGTVPNTGTVQPIYDSTVVISPNAGTPGTTVAPTTANVVTSAGTFGTATPSLGIQFAPSGVVGGAPSAASIAAVSANGTTTTLPLNQTALIDLRVPPDAEVLFQGVRMTQTGPVRRFISPALTPGQDYSYDVRVSWAENGRRLSQDRRIVVRAGDRLNLDLTTPPPAVTQDSGANNTSPPSTTATNSTASNVAEKNFIP
jgi:uncharacterized protein (TIGR03000 family)